MLETVLDSWLTPAIAPHRQRLERIGHRVVHGGERFTAPTLITAEVERQLTELIPLAMHNPPGKMGTAGPGCPQWACFDTAFHSACRQPHLAIPRAFKGRGLGASGFRINHQHVAEFAAAATGPRPQKSAPDQCTSGGRSLPGGDQRVCIDTTSASVGW